MIIKLPMGVTVNTNNIPDNFDNIIRFLSLLNSEQGLNISARNITVSTCGIVPKIIELADKKLQITLAISLHAPNDELRSKLMPINKAYHLEELMDTIKEYIAKTNRRVTFEYIMLENINDSEKEAKELVKLLKGINCYVNLIPYNETENIGFKRTKKWKILAFYDILLSSNI